MGGRDLLPNSLTWLLAASLQGCLTTWQLASSRASNPGQSKRKRPRQRPQSFYNLMSEVIFHPSAILYLWKSNQWIQSTPNPRRGDYTRVWIPECRDHTGCRVQGCLPQYSRRIQCSLRHSLQWRKDENNLTQEKGKRLLIQAMEFYTAVNKKEDHERCLCICMMKLTNGAVQAVKVIVRICDDFQHIKTNVLFKKAIDTGGKSLKHAWPWPPPPGQRGSWGTGKADRREGVAGSVMFTGLYRTINEKKRKENMILFLLNFAKLHF